MKLWKVIVQVNLENLLCWSKIKLLNTLCTYTIPAFLFLDLYTLLLEDILVLLQKQDDRLVLRCHSKILASTADSKHTFSPVIKLNTVLVRQVATGKYVHRRVLAYSFIIGL